MAVYALVTAFGTMASKPFANNASTIRSRQSPGGYGEASARLPYVVGRSRGIELAICKSLARCIQSAGTGLQDTAPGGNYRMSIVWKRLILIDCFVTMHCGYGHAYELYERVGRKSSRPGSILAVQLPRSATMVKAYE
ncbi:hypothetical protein AJ79_01725 [Helicocarpus griseus UAMH5409]|uniref:Uncharacterized protein n=1 Tax=Helicocarpus griseus UAMH5409 TaxID=1447875 RepID=A0A2B7XX91_9EURO|nr:hypothetical protein AJ79_01725 [Helicocarpus griseus UAMH5409]